MNIDLFKNAADRQELEAELMIWAITVLDPPKIIRDRDGKIRVYKSPEFFNKDALDLRFFYQNPDSKFDEGQWFCRLIDGATHDKPAIDFYSVAMLCNHLENIFLCELAE